MTKRLEGRTGDLVRFCLASRNWLLVQMEGEYENFTRTPVEGGRSAEEVVVHVSWVIASICRYIADQLGIHIPDSSKPDAEEGVESLKAEVNSAYDDFAALCAQLDDVKLDTEMELPPPARLREGSVERILRIMAGYHVVHHAGQVALLLGNAKRNSV